MLWPISPVSKLSKGMKQRLSLGRTMIHDPAVLILDEPAAGLDPRARIELREMISRLAQAGKAVLISSHILTELAEICDKVAIIETGQLLAVGTMEEISARSESVSRVRLRTLEECRPLVDWLAGRDDVTEIVVDGQLVMLTHNGGPEEQAQLLKENRRDRHLPRRIRQQDQEPGRRVSPRD